MDDVVVRGEAVVTVLPDRAVVTAVVEAEGADRDRAYAAAVPLAAAVDATLAAATSIVERVVSAGVVVQPRVRWHKGQSVTTGWTARRSSDVTIRDLTAVGDLLARLVAAGAALSGVEWIVDPTNPAHDEVRAAAAADAARRAQAYAGGLGVDLGPVAWMAEPGLRGPGHQPPMYAEMSMARGGAPGPEDGIIDVAPERVTLHAAVEVAFTLRRPAAAPA